jgi:hypothetical protein
VDGVGVVVLVVVGGGVPGGAVVAATRAGASWAIAVAFLTTMTGVRLANEIAIAYAGSNLHSPTALVISFHAGACSVLMLLFAARERSSRILLLRDSTPLRQS